MFILLEILGRQFILAVRQARFTNIVVVELLVRVALLLFRLRLTSQELLATVTIYDGYALSLAAVIAAGIREILRKKKRFSKYGNYYYKSARFLRDYGLVFPE